MADEIYKEIISTLYDYALTGTDVRIFIRATAPSGFREGRSYTASIAPLIAASYGFYGAYQKADVNRLLSFHLKSTPFIGTKELKAREAIKLIKEIIQGEDNE